MAYQLKYYFDFYRLKTSEKHTIQIEQDTATVLTPEEITGAAHPFMVEMPSLSHLFQVVRGKGCTLNLLSDTDGKFFEGLYHVNPLEFKVKHLINDTLNGVYLLESEIMQEPFDQNKNYPVTVTGSDGFALMDRFSFIQVDETNYTGLKSQIELLQICLNKIGIWENIGLSLSTDFDYGGIVYSMLHETYIDCSNFYDEDDKPMTLRAVVDSILAPYGAHIYSEYGSVYICDIHTKATGESIQYSMFALSDLSTVVSGISVDPIAITADKYMGTGQIKEQSGGVNRQVVTYSPYPVKSVIDKSLTGIEEFETVPSEWDEKYGYHYKELEGNEFWEVDFPTIFGIQGTVFEASYYTNEKDTNIYLTRPCYTDDDIAVFSLKVNPFVAISGAVVGQAVATRSGHLRQRANYTQGVAVKLSGEVLVKTKDNPYTDTAPLTANEFTQMYLKARIKIGSYYYNGDTGNWTTTPATFWIYVAKTDSPNLSDQWISLGLDGQGITIPIVGLSSDLVVSGELELEFLTTFRIFLKNSSLGEVYNYSPIVKEIWHKELSVKITNIDGSEISDEDIEYIGNLDRNFQDEGEKITLTCGTVAQFADRGKLLKQVSAGVYESIKEWTRAGQTYKLEELLLGSVCSNYRSGLITLNGMKLMADFSVQKILTESTLPGKRLMVKSAKIDYWDNVIECDLTEIRPDELTIEKLI